MIPSFKRELNFVRTCDIRWPAVGFIIPSVLIWMMNLPAHSQEPPKKISFDTYRMVRTRNIFDPDRRAMSTPQAGAVAVSKPLTRSDYVALTGTMVTDHNVLAFFSGSRPEYNRVLSVNTTIANATIRRITSASIEVERGGKRITVAVGLTVPLDDSAPAAPPTTDLVSTPANPPPSSGLPADASAIMRRMMEKRQQELK